VSHVVSQNTSIHAGFLRKISARFKKHHDSLTKHAKKTSGINTAHAARSSEFTMTQRKHLKTVKWQAWLMGPYRAEYLKHMAADQMMGVRRVLLCGPMRW
jgi:hypothetical protein